MVRRKLTINNPTGLHLRPAGLFCKTAMQFQSKINISFQEYNCQCQECVERIGCLYKKKVM